jgi:hypothetical protein
LPPARSPAGREGRGPSGGGGEGFGRESGERALVGLESQVVARVMSYLLFFYVMILERARDE